MKEISYIDLRNRMQIFPQTRRNDDGDDGIGSMMLVTAQVKFLIAMVVMDTWNYFMHKYIMHENKFFYKHMSTPGITGL
ncbi:hypothetical protein ACLB2K_074652 [Fragaria x ananassa]